MQRRYKTEAAIKYIHCKKKGVHGTRGVHMETNMVQYTLSFYSVLTHRESHTPHSLWWEYLCSQGHVLLLLDKKVSTEVLTFYSLTFNFIHHILCGGESGILSSPAQQHMINISGLAESAARKYTCQHHSISRILAK